jgi:hypothetical protein
MISSQCGKVDLKYNFGLYENKNDNLCWLIFSLEICVFDIRRFRLKKQMLQMKHSSQIHITN